jgi:Zn-dependent membrane protease YugP
MMTYLLAFFLIPLLLSGYASLKVKRTFSKYSQVAASSGMTGAQAAARMLREGGIADVGIEEVQGFLSDHYDPTHKVLRLSPDVYHGRSLSALGVACHEAGHALQHARGYTPLYLRTALVPVASFGSNAGVWMMVLGGAFYAGSGTPLVAYIGFATFAVAVMFSIVTLPVEFNASNRAKAQLTSLGMTRSAEEDKAISKVLSAAAMTYVAAAAVAILQLLYWAQVLGLLGSRDE